MSIQFIVPKKSGAEHREPLKMKNCAFPGCKVKQKMTGRACFCTEHRLRKYRKIIDAKKIEAKKVEEQNRTANQIIKHQYTESVLVKQKCGLEGCNNEFEFKIYSNIYCYPRYCPDHRNEYKRKKFIETNSK